MREITVNLPDEIFERAERRAHTHGASLSGEVGDFIRRYGDGNGQDNIRPTSQGAARERFQGAAKQDILRNLSAVAEECQKDSWDGNGSVGVKSETLRHARRFVDALPAEHPVSSVGVEPDGHLTLEWYRSPTWTLTISVSPESDLYYAALFGVSDVRGRESFSDMIPEILLSLIRRVEQA